MSKRQILPESVLRDICFHTSDWSNNFLLFLIAVVMAAPGQDQVLSEEEILGKIVCGSVFSSWNEIEDVREKLRVVCHMHTRWLHLKTTESFNKKVTLLFFKVRIIVIKINEKSFK